MTKLTTIPFHDDMLFAIEEGGAVYVAVRPICDGLGIDPKKQRERIQRDPILSEGGATMALPSAGGAQDTFCLRLDLLQGWLFGIDAARVKPEARDRVLTYQRACHAVLYAHFYGRRETVPGGNVSRPLPPAQAAQLVTECRRTFGPAPARLLWRQLGLPVVAGMFAPPAQPELPFPATAERA